MRSTLLFASCFIGAIAVRPTSLVAQAPVQAPQLAEAIQRRDAGDLKGTVAVLQAHLAKNPDDGDALRLLAETLYWQKDFTGASEVSERSLRLHPDDTSLRLQYAQMLIETGHGQIGLAGGMHELHGAGNVFMVHHQQRALIAAG